jgi:hypothetical protein
MIEGWQAWTSRTRISPGQRVVWPAPDSRDRGGPLKRSLGDDRYHCGYANDALDPDDAATREASGGDGGLAPDSHRDRQEVGGLLATGSDLRVVAIAGAQGARHGQLGQRTPVAIHGIEPGPGRELSLNRVRSSRPATFKCPRTRSTRSEQGCKNTDASRRACIKSASGPWP